MMPCAVGEIVLCLIMIMVMVMVGRVVAVVSRSLDHPRHRVRVAFTLAKGRDLA